jgi:uncharacterized protein YhaN
VKLTDLRVDGFGIWSDIGIKQLSDQITVFYGPNEAGKTTLLQFIRTVLYGFNAERRSRYLPPVHGGKPGGHVSLEGPLGRYYIERHLTPADSPTAGGEVRITTPDGGSYGHGALSTILSNVDEAIFNNVFAVGLRELQELNTIDDTAAADLLYKLTSGLDRVSLVDVMRELIASRERLLADDERPAQITNLLAQRDKLLNEIDNLGALERRWSRLTEQRVALDAEANELSRRSQDLEHYGRLLDVTMQVHPAWLKRAKLAAEVEHLGPLQELPEGAVEKLDQIQQRLKEYRGKLAEVGQERERVKKDIADVPVQQALCDAAAKIELYQEQLPWIRQLDDQSKRIQLEISNLEGELKEHWGDIQLPEGVSKQKLPEVSKKTLSSLLPLAKQVRRESSRIKLATRDAEATRSELSELENRLQSTLADRLEDEVPEAIEKASQRVQQFRRRIHLEERVDQLTRQRTELRIATRELDDAGLLPMPKLVALGAAFIFGVVLVLTGIGGWLAYEMSGALAWSVLGMLCIGAALLAKQVLEKSHSSVTASTEVQLEQLEAQVHAAEQERDELDRKLPRGGGALDRRLQTAQADLEALEELVPLEAQRQNARERLHQAEMRLAKHQGGAKEARHKWRATLKANGLPDILLPEHIRVLARRSSELASVRSRLNTLRQEFEQRQRELTLIAGRIAELFIQAEIEPTSKDPQQQLKQLATALAEAQGYIARRDGLRLQDRNLRKEQRKFTRRLAEMQRRRKALLVACGCRNDLQLRERAAYLEEAARLTRMHDEVAHQIASLVRPSFTEEQVAEELARQTGTLVERREDVGRRLAAAQQRLADVYQERGEIQHELKTLVEDRRLAHSQLELSSVEKQLKNALHRWQVLAATWKVLDRICKLYETERQPETLIESSHYLAKLTQGQYTRIWTPLGDKALRVDDREGNSLRLEVLSTGTREAIFLSLRMALIAGYARRGAKLPIILDDVLVNLDHIRMRAAAVALRDFALSGHQLLLFTCHEHIMEAFKDLAVEVRTLPTRGVKLDPLVEELPEPEPEPEPVAEAPQYVPLPVLEIVKVEEELGFAEEELPPPPPRPRKVERIQVFVEDELRLSDEELPIRAEFLDDITLPEPDPDPELEIEAEEFDYTLAEAPAAKPAQPLLPPRQPKANPKPATRPAPKPMSKPIAKPAPVVTIEVDDELEPPPSRFTWESPERWWRDPNDSDAA